MCDDLRNSLLHIIELYSTAELYYLTSQCIRALHLTIRVVAAAEDCFQLGKYAFESRDFYHAVLWLNESLRVVDTETTKTVPKPVILEYLSASMFQVRALSTSCRLALLATTPSLSCTLEQCNGK